jgi:hypothetical protein
MDGLFDIWKTKIPKYSEVHRNLFESFSQKFGAEGEKKIDFGKHFSTNYELYIFAFFLGLYKDEFSPIPDDEKKIDFSHHIQHWGSKSTSLRKDFTIIQEYIFIALFAKTNLDFIGLEKGEIDEDEIIKKLLFTMEAYTNGGLILIKDKMEENPNYFLQPTSFLNMILDSKIEKEDILESD